MLSDGFFDPRKPFFFRSGGALPHLRQDGATYFVTFRLIDSLPEEKLQLARQEYAAWSHARPDATYLERDEYTRARRNQLERWLDKGAGSCVLARPDASDVVSAAIRHFEGSRYELGEFAIAPNHVHVVLRTSVEFDLSKVLHSWKGYTSRQILKLPGIPQSLRGALWQGESFDHIVRNQESLRKISAYVANHRR